MGHRKNKFSLRKIKYSKKRFLKVGDMKNLHRKYKNMKKGNLYTNKMRLKGIKRKISQKDLILRKIGNHQK